MAQAESLTDALGYTFRAPKLLKRALTHPAVGPDNNQRLEFLGDAVLQLCVSDRIYRAHPDEREGALTQVRQRLVREETLARVASDVGLGQYLILDHGAEASGARAQRSVLADAMEAVLAAIYLDGGFQAVKTCVDKLWGSLGDDAEIDAKSELQAYLQARGEDAPTYVTLTEEGPPHNRVFTVAALIDGVEQARGMGTSKKRAEQQAAGNTLNIINKRAGE